MYAYCANDPINYVDPSGHKKAFIGWGIQLEASLKCGFYGLRFIWFNNKVDKRLDGYKFHLYTYGGLSYPTEEKTKIRNQIKNNPKRLKTKDGLKKICKKLKKNTSLAACIIAIWAETDKFNSYEDYEDGFIAFTLTTYHATFSLGIGSSSVVAGFGISYSKVSVSISAGITTFREGWTRGLRNSILKIRGYVKGKAEQL